MRNPADRRWQTWQLAPRDAAPAGPRFARNAGEPAGPDGIRWGLVARVRAEIEAGTYDAPERWAAAEERLFGHRDGD